MLPECGIILFLFVHSALCDCAAPDIEEPEDGSMPEEEEARSPKRSTEQVASGLGQESFGRDCGKAFQESCYY